MSTTIHFKDDDGSNSIVCKTPFNEAERSYDVALRRSREQTTHGSTLVKLTLYNGKSAAVPAENIRYMEES